MKQILIISSIFLVLISVSMVGYHVVSANEEVEEIKDQINAQVDKEIYLTPYGYTLENPNIVLNPYGTSPLTAMILFETKKSEEVTLTILGKDKETTFTNTFKSTTSHILPIYGLYPDTENKIEIKCDSIIKTYIIKTDPLPKEIDTTIGIISNEGISLNQSNNYLYGLDKNKDVRWLYESNTSNYPYLLENNHLLISGSSSVNYLMEIDLNGKIYNQYHLENYDSRLVIEKDSSLFIVSKNLIELDKQTGTILNTYPLEHSYKKITLDETKDNIILQNEQEELIIDLKTKQQTKNPNSKEILISTLNIQPYTTNTNYKIRKGVKFENKKETEKSKKNIFLIGYKEPDKVYKKYNIEINQTQDNIQISGEFSKQDKVYIILDKFLDKRIYDFEENNITITKEGLSGKYSIYIKINDTIYKTNTYVNF